MKHLKKIALSFLLAPLVLAASGTASAQGSSPLSPDVAANIVAALAAGKGEQVYVLYNENVEVVSESESPERVLELCNFMLKSGFEPEFPAFNVAYRASVANLYSLKTTSSHGKLVNSKVSKVGESIACTGDETTDQVVVPGIYFDTPEFPNGTPSGKTNQAIEITIGGQTYYALGSGSIRTDPGRSGIPYPNFLLMIGSFTLHKMVDDPEPGWDVVGAYSSNVAMPVGGLPISEGVAGGIVTLRISPHGDFVPRYILAGSN